MINKLRKIVGHVHFDNLFYKRIKSFLKKDYDPVILQRTSCLVIDLDSQGLVLHDGVSLNLSPEGHVGFSYPSISVIP